jgi:hypothetical protein
MYFKSAISRRVKKFIPQYTLVYEEVNFENQR